MIFYLIDVLIKTIGSLTENILKQMSHDYLYDYTKFEYVLISYYRKIDIVQNFIKMNQHQIPLTSSHNISNTKYLLHVIDLNQAPKFFSDKAFKQFEFSEQNQVDNDIETLKDLVLLDLRTYVKIIFFSFILSIISIRVVSNNRIPNHKIKFTSR